MLFSNRCLGVMGGLGPQATAYFMELVTIMTDAVCDQQHINMIIFSIPSTPDRTAYILDHSKPDPLPYMLEAGKQLAGQGVSNIAIPCVTAHYFFDVLEKEIPVPIINGVQETVLHLKANGIHRVGIMATDGTIQSRIFHRALEREGMIAVTPDAQAQREIMHLIFNNIKAGKPVEMARFAAAAAALRKAGAEAIILGCTELSLIKKAYPLGPGFIDAMEVLAQQAVLRSGSPLKAEYENLITK